MTIPNILDSKRRPVGACISKNWPHPGSVSMLIPN
uniref:Uncharacterized protein n=1 Tax=Knipowitschia caucasica TaxID=637954 RepID=A0AAV2KKM6_KNICA